MNRLFASLAVLFAFSVPIALLNTAAFATTESETSTATKAYEADAHLDENEIKSNFTDDDSAHEDDEGKGAHHFGIVFAMFALVLIAGKLGNVVEKYGQPAVIGELLAGVALSASGYFGWGFIGDIASNEIISFLAQFGAVLLLFSVGLESNIKELLKVGTSSVRVAIIGVVVPFVLGTYVFGPIFFGDESTNAKLFLGAALVATSVGIPSTILKSLKVLKTNAGKTFLGATVLDDVVGLIILAIVSALATGGDASVALVITLVAKAVGFLLGAIILGGLLAKQLSKLFSYVSSGIGMKLALAIGFALTFGYIAELFGLEPIIGAFAAGLLLDAVHFESFSDPEIIEDIRHLEGDETVASIIKKHRHAHVEDLINSIGLIFIPIFFVYTGLQIDFGSLLDPGLYVTAIVISFFAFLAKFLAGFGAKGTRAEKMMIGSSMVPRGEVGLIFAATGSALGVLNDEMFSIIVLVVIMTTFIAPTFIKKFGLQVKEEEKLARAEARKAALKKSNKKK
jgi:Kef-type K+ transport system membrane component KefB